jgi:hypothetical protein
MNSPKNMSSNESSGENENIVLKLKDEHDSSIATNNLFKIKLDEVPEQSKRYLFNVSF